MAREFKENISSNNMIYNMSEISAKDGRMRSNTEPNRQDINQNRTNKNITCGIISGTLLVLPTLNAENWLPEWLEALKGQSVQPENVVLVDSESTDQTTRIAETAGLKVVSINRKDFSHGGTRQIIADSYPDCEIVIYLTQDAILSNRKSLEKLLKQFDDKKVGAAYGRQRPRVEADQIEAHARLFNYPPKSQVRSAEDIPRLGIKSSFISNSFAAWRKSALDQVGGFPDHTIQNEDAWVASKMIKSGWKVAYCADAEVRHSHPMTIVSEFKRYFDTGVFHSQAPWIRKDFGNAGGEGARFVKSELNHLVTTQPQSICSAIMRTGAKLIAFKLGCIEDKLPIWLKEKISSNHGFWKQQTCQKGVIR